MEFKEMDVWEDSKDNRLVENTTTAAALEGYQPPEEEEVDRKAQQCNEKVLLICLCQAVKRATKREKGIMLFPMN
eukprot:226254-Ditylum_brightwellii.AAC.1